MKTRVDFVTLLMLVALTTACEQHPAGPVANTIALESIEFLSSEVGVGEPLVLIATSAHPISNSPIVVQFSSSSGVNAVSATMLPWTRMSDEGMLAALRQANGRVGIGFKEADSERGVSPHGENLTSAVTVKRAKEFLVSSGITITDDSADLPYVIAHAPATLALVGTVRQHPNIDYFEPILPGEYLNERASPHAELAIAVAATGAGPGGLRVQRGDVVTAVYRQPDGSILKSMTVVR